MSSGVWLSLKFWKLSHTSLFPSHTPHVSKNFNFHCGRGNLCWNVEDYHNFMKELFLYFFFLFCYLHIKKSSRFSTRFFPWGFKFHRTSGKMIEPFWFPYCHCHPNINSLASWLLYNFVISYNFQFSLMLK